MTNRSEQSAEAVVAAGVGDRGPPQREGPNGEESETPVDHEEAMHQMSNDQFELPLEQRGEAPTGERSGEARATGCGTERWGEQSPLPIPIGWLVQPMLGRADAVTPRCRPTA